MIENEVNHDDDDGRQFSMDLSTHSRFAMAFDLKVPPPYVSPSLHYEPKTADFIQKTSENPNFIIFCRKTSVSYLRG